VRAGLPGAGKPGESAIPVHQEAAALERGALTSVAEGVPAMVCADRGEEYLDSSTTERVLRMAGGAAASGARRGIRAFPAASWASRQWPIIETMRGVEPEELGNGARHEQRSPLRFTVRPGTLRGPGPCVTLNRPQKERAGAAARRGRASGRRAGSRNGKTRIP